MDSHHRKIDLQSQADLLYLLDNIHTSAREKIDLAIPRSAAPEGEQDAYRTKVEELVRDYIHNTFALALPSLSINGFDASAGLLEKVRASGTPRSGKEQASGTGTMTEAEIAAGNYEAYDPRLADNLRNMYIQFEHEAEHVAKLRREVPGRAAKAYVDVLGAQLAAEAGARDEMARVPIVRAEQGDSLRELLGQAGVERLDRLQGTWELGFADMDGLSGIQDVLTRGERVLRALDVVETA